jgi:hypothetical protein
MQYERFLEMHLVERVDHSQSDLGDLFADGVSKDRSGRFQYDFLGEVQNQRVAYRRKLQDAFDNDVPFWSNLSPKNARALHVDHVLGSGGAPLTKQILESQHYVSCFVDLASLRPGEALIPELQTLVAWVSEADDTSIKRGKLRLNSHGSARSNAGLKMGDTSLSPEDLVDALIRHGLGTRDRQYSSGRQNLVAKDAQWKADSKVTKCEEKGCTTSFNFITRRHHCRSCGGIFCDAHTKKRRTLRNPLTEGGRADGTVADCRVCDSCASKVETIRITTVKAGTGLVQIALALCLTARSEQEFATAKAGFARNSIAGRLVKQLAMRGVHGIQVSGSNEVLQGTNTEYFGIQYPGMSAQKKPASQTAYDEFEGTGFAGPAGNAVQLEIPCSILGSRDESSPVIPSIIGEAKYDRIRDQKIVPIRGGNAMAFGVFQANSAERTLVEELVGKGRDRSRAWKFTSWRITEVPLGQIGELTRFAGILSDPVAQVARGAPRSGPQSTFVIDAQQRNVKIIRSPGNPNSLIVSGFEQRRFRDFKIIEVS